MTSRQGRPGLRAAAILVLYLLLAGIYTRPLLEQSSSRIASDPYDPILNASILWWNATVLPFSERWWSPPFFFPAQDITAFTEHLVGVSLFASPLYWLTGNPLTAYNLAFFLTWPLSAFAAYQLVLFLTRRQDAAFLAGLAYGFSPYRTAELAHLQSLSSYWLPIVVLGLHGFLDQRRRRWLVLFGGAWLLQSLSNGYFMLHGAVLIGLWLLYFCSSRESWRVAPPVVFAWGLASLPLVLIMLKYRAVHEHFGLRRTMDEALYFSARASAWFEVTQFVRFWHPVLPDSKDNLFPGLTVVTLVLLAALMSTVRYRPEFHEPPRGGRVARTGLSLVIGGSLIASLILITFGPWRVAVGDLILFRMENLNRAVGLLVLCGVLLLLLTVRTPAALTRRSPLLFYAGATVVLALLSCGPVLRVGNNAILDHAPYRWLMYLPGFDQLRVPTRFWMLGILCLATAGGLAFNRLLVHRGPVRMMVLSLMVCGVLLDGWLREMPMATAPGPWPEVERGSDAQPILELPLGPEWDAAATFRSMWHRRRVVNGVSGYEPPHYAPLQAGLNARDPAILVALASLGSFDVVVNEGADPDGSWSSYVSGAAGVMRVGSDGTRTAYRIPAVILPEPVLGDRLSIAGVQASRHDPGRVSDGRLETEWGDSPQRPGQWFVIDLGEVHEVGGVMHALGEYARDFPRLLAIDLSLDGSNWQQVWEGQTAALAFLAAAREPRGASMHIEFARRRARFVRLRQLAKHENLWRVAELAVHAPATR